MAVTAEVDIANLALDILGVTQKLTALTDATKEGQAANRWYSTCRDLVARALPWRFNKRYSTTLTEVTTEINQEWGHLYTLPTDFLVARRIVTGNRIERTEERAAFDVMLNAAGSTLSLVTDFFDSANGLILEYTARLTDVTKFPDHFVETLAYKLASQMAMPLAVRPDMAKLARDGYRATLADAWSLERASFQPDAPPDSEFIGVR